MNHLLCHIDALKDNEPRGCDVAGHRIVLVRQGTAVFALDNACPHQHRPLDTGIVKDRTIRCRYHGITFALPDGKLVYDAGFLGISDIAVYPVSVQDDQVVVSLPD